MIVRISVENPEDFVGAVWLREHVREIVADIMAGLFAIRQSKRFATSTHILGRVVSCVVSNAILRGNYLV